MGKAILGIKGELGVVLAGAGVCVSIKLGGRPEWCKRMGQ